MTASAKKKLLIRADASPSMGTGHIMRCFALAQSWIRSGGQAVLLGYCEGSALPERIAAEGVTFIPMDSNLLGKKDVDRLLTTAGELKESSGVFGPWVVLDGYHFDSAYQLAIKKAGHKLLCFDDYGHADRYWTDIVVNQNAYADAATYDSKEAYTRILAGSDYVVLRREFLDGEKIGRDISSHANRVLVTFGGSDPADGTLKVAEAVSLMHDDSLDVRIMVGVANSSVAAIREVVSGCNGNVEVLTDVTNMSQHMMWADIAVGSAGTTSWEMAFLGLPAIVTSIAENQVQVAESLQSAGAACYLGCVEDVTSDEIALNMRRLLDDSAARANFSENGRNLVDGKGSARIIKAMMSAQFELRPACEEDCRLIWEWANEPSVRAVSFNTNAIPWDEHVEWFAGKIADEDCFFYIACSDKGIPFGQVRFDLNGGEATVSICLDAAVRGQGYGSAVIEAATRKFFYVSDATTVNAYIRHENVSSVKAFVSADYQENESCQMAGQTAVHMTACREG